VKLTILAGMAILLPAATWAADVFDVKPGLWESTSVTKVSGMQIPDSALANLPKEKRDQIEAMMNQAHTNTAKVCITKDVLARGFTSDMGKNANCTQKTTSLTSSKVEIHIECTGASAMVADMVIERVDSEHAKGTLTGKGGGNGRGAGMSMSGTFSTKYLGSDCGDVKPIDAMGAKDGK